MAKNGSVEALLSMDVGLLLQLTVVIGRRNILTSEFKC